MSKDELGKPGVVEGGARLGHRSVRNACVHALIKLLSYEARVTEGAPKDQSAGRSPTLLLRSHPAGPEHRKHRKHRKGTHAFCCCARPPQDLSTSHPLKHDGSLVSLAEIHARNMQASRSVLPCMACSWAHAQGRRREGVGPTP